jgi:hypothetical protein
MLAMVLALVALLAPPPQDAGHAVVEIGVWYGGAGVRPDAVETGLGPLRTEFAALRRAGFNAVTLPVRWRDAEPTRSTYSLSDIERLIAAAAEADLRVTVAVVPDPPAWAGADADVGPFLAYVRRRLALNAAVARVVGHAETENARIDVRDSLPAARLAMWAAITRGARAVTFAAPDGSTRPLLPLGETAGVITRNEALFAPLEPRQGGVVSVSSDGGGAAVDVKLLESAEALLIVGLNYAPAPRRATIAFTPEIPEAIWQNLETGTTVNFVMGKGGPVLEHTFAPRDALVLMIRKKLR